MPAVVRGGARAGAQRSQPKPASRPRPRSGPRGRSYAPAKIGAVRRFGIRPGWAVSISAGMVVIGLVAALVTGDRFQRLVAKSEHSAALRLAGLGFRLNAVHVEGATPEASADILRAIALKKNEPILGLDLAALRGRVEQVGWVKTARIVRLLPDALVISVVQRDAAAVWQDGGLIQLPAEKEDSALIQLDELDQKARILDLGFSRIDLRDPDMVAVRPKDGGTTPSAAAAVTGA